ncbi:MAG: exodeoxyribonuclease VII large subunit [Chitinispirillales bacterium]|jgi:exodeoxyribonuclease VII large subunit|nr:exodeoxyribonuclease VII large subunit [Chitinispirillales bacterium]
MFNFHTPQQSEFPYTVSEINAGIAQILDECNTLVWVEGEISGFKSYPSGHCYFKLKDEQSTIPGVMWKSAVSQLNFDVKDNMAVLIIGSVRVYQKGGYYQLDVHRMMPAGVGALHLAFEKLKEKLLKEGLFDAAHKRPLPRSVGTLGVITSKNGAALWDIVRVVATRAPQTDIIIMDTAVQGEKAAPQIAKAIREMNCFGQVDLMIVGRGGGSIEDLWAFNEEVVARAVYDSQIPVISAVGHEIDYTIADFVADVRAATPSAAAQMAVPDCKESDRFFQACARQLINRFNDYFTDVCENFDRIKSSKALLKPIWLLQDAVQSYDDIERRYSKNMKTVMSDNSKKLQAAAARLNALSPLAVLNRGYSVVQDSKGSAVKSAKALKAGDNVKIRFSDGSAEAKIEFPITA